MPTKFNIGESVRAKGGVQGTVVSADEAPGDSVRVKMPDGKEQKFASGELEKITADKPAPVAWGSTERSGNSGI